MTTSSLITIGLAVLTFGGTAIAGVWTLRTYVDKRLDQHNHPDSVSAMDCRRMHETVFAHLAQHGERLAKIEANTDELLRRANSAQGPA
ncbi:MAG: hypothetical protein ABIE42_09125 [Candidatus Eisenbacteria bacterium]